MTEALGSLLVFLLVLAIPGFLVVRAFVPQDIELREDEILLMKSSGMLSIDRLMPAGAGSIYLTDQRLIWKPTSFGISFLITLSGGPGFQEVRLRDISHLSARRKEDKRKVGPVDAFIRPHEVLRASRLEIGALDHLLFFGFIGLNPFKVMGEPERWMDAILTARGNTAAHRFMPATVLSPGSTRWIAIRRLISIALAGLLAVIGSIWLLRGLVESDSGSVIVGLVVILSQITIVAFQLRASKSVRTPRNSAE